MTVYQVWDWDPMASNHGEAYCEGTYAVRAVAEAKAKALNDARREHFLATCSPAACENLKYLYEANVQAVTLK